MLLKSKPPEGRDRPGLSARGITAVVLGNALEFYDFGVYAAFAVMIARAFFPFGDGLLGLLLSLATFGVGFVSRPLGGFLLGAYADRYGRKPALTLTIALMALGTAAIGLLPTYEQIGIAAPLLLVLARLIQGFSAGGELGASTTYLFEAAAPGRQASTGAWQLASQGVASVIVGLVGYALASILPPADLNGWGWRIPFLLGLAIIPVGIYIRRRLDETLDAKEAHATASGLFSDLLRGHWASLVLSIAMFSGVTITQYFFIYMTTFSLTTLHMPATTALLVNFVIGVSTFVFALVGGRLGDRAGLTATTLWPRVVLVLALYPVMMIVVSLQTPASLLLATGALMIPQAIGGGVLVLLIARCFPPAVRTTGLATAFGVGAALFGGTAQIIFTWLIGVTGDPLSPVWYVTAMNVVSAAATYAITRVARDEKTPSLVPA